MAFLAYPSRSITGRSGVAAGTFAVGGLS